MKLAAMQVELAKTERKRQQLIAKIEDEQRKRLKELPALVGLKNIDELFMALASLASSHLKSELLANSANGKTRGSKKNKRSSLRERFDPVIKARVKADMRAGEKTMAQIAAAHGPSIHSLRIWKRKWGLTKVLKRRKV